MDLEEGVDIDAGLAFRNDCSCVIFFSTFSEIENSVFLILAAH